MRREKQENVHRACAMGLEKLPNDMFCVFYLSPFSLGVFSGEKKYDLVLGFRVGSYG